MFDEMFLQKCQEYCGGELIGADENNELYKGLVSFMIVGMKKSIPYIIKSVPEKKIDGKWLKEQVFDCLKTLKDCGFNVRAIVSDNHSTNVSAYNMLLQETNQPCNGLFMLYESQKLYLLHDTVHLVKNVRNNLLNYKRFIFPAFKFNDFKDEISLEGGEISWKLFDDILHLTPT